MIWVKFKRVIKAGFINFTRNGFVSLAAVLIMTVTLFVIGSVVFALAALNNSLEDIKDKVDVSVYFTTDASTDDIQAVQKSLQALPAVSTVSYVSKEDALKAFSDRHQGDSLTLQALEELGTNPFGAILNVKAKDPSQYESIANYLKTDSALSKDNEGVIDRINYFDNKNAIDKLTSIIRAAEKLGMAISILLILISGIIAFNTIRLAIYISREEISVMRLVGASHKYIRGPFVVTGIIYGLVAGVLTLAIFYPVTLWAGKYTANFFGDLNFFTYYTVHFGEFLLITVGAGVGLGAVSSFWAVRRYLRS
jgi:cell division transport system permease protein